MSKNPANKEGVFLAPAQGRVINKNVSGSTQLKPGSYALDHADGPLTPTTDRDNIGVNTKPPPKG